ncbi:MAG: 30S ribosomal protein S7 [Planctomycetes bacterium]|nr:30S ribosomal protein S7 [Planctomycetota bacterium]
MPRKYDSPERFLKPDPKYGSRLVSKFINSLMVEGKKSVSQQILYEALAILEKRVKDQRPDEVFTQAVENVKPLIEVRSKRVGGATYQVPMEVKKNRQQALAFRWIIDAARKKRGRPMARRLADELQAAYNKEGEAINKREIAHKMAEANKAFAHFAW